MGDDGGRDEKAPGRRYVEEFIWAQIGRVELRVWDEDGGKPEDVVKSVQPASRRVEQSLDQNDADILYKLFAFY